MGPEWIVVAFLVAIELAAVGIWKLLRRPRG